MKKVLVQFSLPGVTTKQYDQTWETLRKTGQAEPKGLIHHTGCQTGNTIMVCDVWESEEAYKKFGDTLTPIMTKLGITNTTPTIIPVHYDYCNN
jgi:hypothetical protein